MTGQAASHDGFVVAPGTWAMLLAAKTVTVVTNGRAVPRGYFQSVAPGDGDAFVVFNRHRFTMDERHAVRTVWVHRMDEVSGRYFGDTTESGRPTRAFHHLYVAGDDPRDVSLPADVSHVSYRAPLPGLAGYPVGRRLLLPQRGIRRIVSPSTGFVVFALLDELRRQGAGFRIRAVGIGREYDGWPGHDWKFERRRLLRRGIDFRQPDGRPDRWRSLLDWMPYELVRAAGKLKIR